MLYKDDQLEELDEYQTFVNNSHFDLFAVQYPNDLQGLLALAGTALHWVLGSCLLCSAIDPTMIPNYPFFTSSYRLCKSDKRSDKIQFHQVSHLQAISRNEMLVSVSCPHWYAGGD